MQTSESLQRYFVSRFVISAFLDEFNGSLSANITMAVGMAHSTVPPAPQRSSMNPALPMASVLGAVQEICGRVEVTSENDLEQLLKAIECQFGAVSVCNQQDRQAALEDLEDCLEAAAQAAREAWREASAGFPLSGGSFAIWRRDFWNRKHGFADHDVVL